MAAISKRLRKQPDGTYKQTGWQVRYVDPDGVERRRSFKTRDEAKDFQADVHVQIRRGAYVDAAAGKETFKDYAERWRQVQPWRPGTAQTNHMRLRKYVYPVLGNKAIGSIRPTDVQAMVKKAQLSMDGRKVDGKEQPLAPSTVHAIAAMAQAVFLAAVEDSVIAKSPASKLALPGLDDHDTDDEGEVIALTREQFRIFEAALPPRLRIAAWIGLGTGMRIGEVCGLTEDRIDFLKRQVRVNRQMLASGQFGPPKTKTSRRTIPVTDELLQRINKHLAEHADIDRERRLIISGPRGGDARGALLEAVAAAARKAGLSDRQRFHSLRHTYASILLSGRCSIKVVQARLGHATAQETLDTYGHMLPEDEDRSRQVVEAAMHDFAIGPSSAQSSAAADEPAGQGT